RPAPRRSEVRVPARIGPARRPHRGVHRAWFQARPRGRRAGARPPRSPRAGARDRPDARRVGGGAPRHRPRGRDPARERRAELSNRQGRRHRPVPAPVPGAPLPARPSAPRVLVVGSANVDFTIAAKHLPRPGETVTGGTLLVSRGGKGANQAVAARRLGAEVRLLACVGDDSAGREIRAEDLAWADIVLCQLETPLPTVAWALGEARRRGRVTLLNPAPMRDEAPTLIPLADYLTPNEIETERLSGIAVRDAESAAAAARMLRSRGAGTVIVTLGARGALACAADGLVRAPALPVAVVDTTAAGDAFNAGLAV